MESPLGLIPNISILISDIIAKIRAVVFEIGKTLDFILVPIQNSLKTENYQKFYLLILVVAEIKQEGKDFRLCCMRAHRSQDILDLCVKEIVLLHSLFHDFCDYHIKSFVH